MIVADRYDAFLFDLDGVLYRGSEPVPRAADAVARLRRIGKRVAFVTNNSSRTPEAVAERLAAVGVPAAPDEVVTSAHATARLLVDRGLATAFVIGEEGLRTAIAAAGVRVVDGTGAGPDAVVVGLDRGVDYERLRAASVLVQHGAALIGSNADGSFPAPRGERWPGAGALLAAIETTTGTRAEVVGKPRTPLFEAALDRTGGGVPLVVGDRIDTDIAGAAALGWDSVLVLTGVSTREDAGATATPPTYVVEDLDGLFDDVG